MAWQGSKKNSEWRGGAMRKKKYPISNQGANWAQGYTSKEM